MAEALKKPDDSLYERDFYAWTVEQAAKLRARAVTDNIRDVDWENAAEEIESLGRSQRSEIRSRLLVILVHLLKWRFQTDQRPSGWRGTLAEQRRRIVEEIEDSPSLRSYPAKVFDKNYDIARLKAADETGIPENAFPPDCPFTVDEILDPDFYPDGDA